MHTIYFLRGRKNHKPLRVEGPFEGFIWWTLIAAGVLFAITFADYDFDKKQAPWFMLFFLIAWLCMMYIRFFSKLVRTERNISANIAGRQPGDLDETINTIARNSGLPSNYVRAILENIASSYSVPAENLSHDDLIGCMPAPPDDGEPCDIPPGLHIDGDDAGLLGDFLLWDLDWDQSRDTKVRLQEISNRKGLTISRLCVALYPLYRAKKIELEMKPALFLKWKRK